MRQYFVAQSKERERNRVNRNDLRFDFAGEVSEENEETFRAETKRKRDRVCEMTAKKKQKKKKMMLKRGVSVSSSSSDDDDENAVKDEKNIERRKEKNIERRKEKIGSEMWELTRAYKKREESVERWLSANKNNASMEGRG